MRFPVNNYYSEWDNNAGYGFGQAVSYGFHCGKDINDNNGGNSDLGKPLYAISKGKIIGVHQHTGKGNFGKHFFLQIEGAWGIRYVHYAHCNELFVVLDQEVTEGQLIATIGNSGTTYAHCHFSIKKKTNGMDTIAKTRVQLDDAWEDPISFIEKNLIQLNPPMNTNDAKGKVHFDRIVIVLNKAGIIPSDRSEDYIDSNSIENVVQGLYEETKRQSMTISDLNAHNNQLKLELNAWEAKQPDPIQVPSEPILNRLSKFLKMLGF